MSRFRTTSLLTAATLLAALAGCSWVKLGPEPDNFIGRGQSETLITDPGLRAVTPRVNGDEPGGGVKFPISQSLSATAPAPVATPATQPVPDALSVQDAILVGLEHNVNLRIQRSSVPIARTSEEGALAQFDPTVTGSVTGGRTVAGGATSDSIALAAGVTQYLPTGTTITGNVTTSNNFYNDTASNNATFSITQALLRGKGVSFNLARLRQAELATRITQYQLRDAAETLVANIENAYWDLAYAEMQVEIVQNSLNVATKQLEDTRARVQVDRVNPTEIPAADARVATARQTLLSAENTLKTQRLKFAQLITPSNRAFWNRTVKLTTLPFIPQGAMDPVEPHLDAAMRFRPDINEALLKMQRGDLEIVITKNGLLPKLDLTLNVGKSGSDYTYGNAFTRSFDDNDYLTTLKLSGEWEPLNRSAKSSYRAAELSREQLQTTMDNLQQLAQLNIRTQYYQVELTRKLIDATRATREAQQTSVNVQKANFDNGRGTQLEWAIAQGQLLNDQLNEVQAVTNHLKALVELYRQEGTLLLRRGIDAPGATPVNTPPVN